MTLERNRNRLLILCLLFLSLSMASTFAHVLEYPQKIKLDSALYASVNSSLYKYFAIVGGTLCMAAILANILLLLSSRKKTIYFYWSAFSLFSQVGWFLSWVLIVAPVNHQVAIASPTQIVELWAELRSRWENGHVVGFMFHFTAFASLLFYTFLLINPSPKKYTSLTADHETGYNPKYNRNELLK